MTKIETDYGLTFPPYLFCFICANLVCEKGFPVSLNSAALGLRVKGKLATVEGIEVPSLWAAGKHDVVMEYVAQDVRTTLAVALKAESQRAFAWTNSQGKTSNLPLPQGWLDVESALRRPLPDTSWMSKPLSRHDFLSWMND